MNATEQFNNLSLLYPDADKKRLSSFGGNASFELGIGAYLAPASTPLECYISDDFDTVLYRQETVKDLLSSPEVLRVLAKCVPIIKDIVELRNLASDSTEDYLCSITEAELYITLIETLSEGILPERKKLTGRALNALCDRIELLTQSEGYIKINNSLKELTSRVRDVKSVCVAINLDGTLKPENAGLVSINDKKFTFPGAIERILKIDHSKSETTCIAPLIALDKNASEAEQTAMKIALNSALSSVFKNDFKAWKRIVRTYVLENTDFLIDLLPECEILTKAVEFISSLKEHGVTLTYPVIVNDNENSFSAIGLVNPVTAMKSDEKMVENDIEFDENAGIYIVTGPNRGGKSVLTCAVGDAVIMAQLGLPVCAEKLEMSLCDNIFCHFPDGAEDTTGKGRLGEECSRLSDIFSKVTKRSLVLLDESLSSTGSYEASCIASEVVSALSVIGCRTVFSTHLHTLASQISEINERCEKLGGVRVDSLVADIESGERSFKIRRASPVGKSFASDIADKYGLSLDAILKKRDIKE